MLESLSGVCPAAGRVVIISGDAVVDEGNTTYLLCVGYGDPETSVSWERDGQLLANNSRVTIYDMLVIEGGSDFTQSVLEICSAELADTGTYTCAASNGVGSGNSSFRLTVRETQGLLCTQR